MMGSLDNSEDLKKAYDYKRRADSASDSLKGEIASDLYFKAAYYFKEACKKVLALVRTLVMEIFFGQSLMKLSTLKDIVICGAGIAKLAL